MEDKMTISIYEIDVKESRYIFQITSQDADAPAVKLKVWNTNVVGSILTGSC